MGILIIFILLFISLLYLTKIFEIGLDFLWVIKNGKKFANDLLIEIGNIKSTKQWIHVWNDLCIKYKREDFLLSKLLNNILAGSKNKTFKQILIRMKNTIYRSVNLTILQSFAVPIFVFLNINSEIYLIFAILILSSCIVLKTFFLLVNNLKMGFVNNFHMSIISNLDKYGRPKLTLSIREILINFLIIFARSITAAIIGFAGIYSSFYFINQTKFFSGIYKSTYSFSIWLKFLYFSIVTITTTGYGDINPINWWSMLFSSLEIVIGLIYLVVLVLSFTLTASHEKVIP